ncbi:hypothetical protein Q3G72_033770 [Acer saccharum]|nr:hypothetical protein Q3G72_033770 [Acer saccharum]
MEAAVTTIVGKLWDCFSDAICRQFRYLCGHKDTIKRLTDEAEKLADTRERVQAKIDEAKTKGEIILSDANKWIQRADDITKEAEEFREEEDKANKRCLEGMCIDPLSRYKFGKEAKRKIETISILKQEGAGFESVSRQAPPPGLIPSSSALSINFRIQSRESITKGIMESLKDENTILHSVTEDATLAGSLGRAILSNRMPFLNSTSFDSFVIKFGCPSFKIFEESPPWSRILYLAGIKYQELDWAYSLTKITDALQLCGMAGLRNILTDLGNHGFNDLKFLQLVHCGEIKYLVNTLECTPKFIVFNSLESLLMHDMNILIEICHGPLPAESFRKLKRMHLQKCNKMLNIVPSDLLRRLHSLESFEARGCLSVVYVFDFERLVIAKEETKFLSSLNHLKLRSLSNMMQIWNGDAKLISLCNLKNVLVNQCSKLRQVFPPALLQSLVSLEHMEIYNCSRLEEIFGKEEEHLEIDYCNSLEEIFGKEEEEEDHQENEIVSQKIDHIATSPHLGNLVLIKISSCYKLKNLFTPSIVKGLVQLRTLAVKFCRTLEEIISDEKAETGGSTERITFPGLYQIDLRGLDSLTCFCARRCTIEFPALELLDIQRCSKMETFGRGDQVTPKLVNMIHLDGKKRWMDNLNITLQQFFKEKRERMQCSQDSDSDSDSDSGLNYLFK